MKLEINSGSVEIRAVDEEDGELLAALVHWVSGGGRLEGLDSHASASDPTVHLGNEELVLVPHFSVGPDIVKH